MKVGRMFTAIFVTAALLVSGCTNQQPALPDQSQGNKSSQEVEPGKEINPSEAVNSSQIQDEFKLNQEQQALLEKNNFVVIPWHSYDIVMRYKILKSRKIPIFVTTDTLLHLYHIQFNEVLRRNEEERFYDQLVDMSLAMLRKAQADYQIFTKLEVKEAARRNVAYFAMALKLLETPSKKIDFDIPRYVKEEVETEIKNIEAHKGFRPSAIFNSDTSCICAGTCCYCEDYSQYVPRGHYTESETLKSYFKAMMWYSRMAFLLKGGNTDECMQVEGPLISEKDAKLATIQAALISAELPHVKVGADTAMDVWTRIYTITTLLVATSDDLTPYDYLAALENVFGPELEPRQFTDNTKLHELKAKLAQVRSPEIYGGSGICLVDIPVTREKLHECLAKTKGLRFMGQRFVPDSYLFQNLVSPAVGMYTGDKEPFTMKMTALGRARCFPRGLDVMAVLGSDRAYDILKREGDTEYEGKDTSYDKQLNSLREEFSTLTEEDWHRNLYWSWLHALKPLLEEYGEGYPAFMQTQAWQDKELNTALASWTELRHDTILYAKGSCTPQLVGTPPPPKFPGYVEPVTEFYTRMLELTNMTRGKLAHFGALSEEEDNRLRHFELILGSSLEIATKELKGNELTQDDYEFIRNFGYALDRVVEGVNNDEQKTTIIADVHTDTNLPMEVLEEGVGYVNLILVAYKVPDGRTIIGAGPTLSYYEFKHPINNRLTDEQWKQMLKTGQAPPRPEWVSSFYSE